MRLSSKDQGGFKQLDGSWCLKLEAVCPYCSGSVRIFRAFGKLTFRGTAVDISYVVAAVEATHCNQP